MRIDYVKQLVAVALVLVGLFMVVFGNYWAPLAFELMAGSEIGAWLEHFVPFLPMAIIGSGAALFVSNHRSNTK